MSTFTFSKTAVLIAVFFIHIVTIAQTNKLGSWNIVNFVYKPNPHLSAFAELQARSQGFFTDFFYHEEKIGIGYNIPKKFSVVLAMGDYRTYDYPGNFKDLQTKEFRLWEQFVLNSYIDPLRIEHRYRIEQRWINGTYRNRFRYRINPIIPINRRTLTPHVFYATVSEEVFFTDKPPYFERNRFFVGAGYLFSSLVTLQTGFIRQFDYHTTDNGSGKNFLQTTLFFSVDKSAAAQVNRHPSTID